MDLALLSSCFMQLTVLQLAVTFWCLDHGRKPVRVGLDSTVQDSMVGRVVPRALRCLVFDDVIRTAPIVATHIPVH